MGRNSSRLDSSDFKVMRGGRAAARSISLSHEGGSIRNLNKVALIFLALAAVFLLRLIFLQVIVADNYTAMAKETRTINFNTSPNRGTIYDRNGVILAVSVDATTIYCNPVEVTDADYEARVLFDELGGDIEDYKELLTKESTQFVYIKRHADVEVAKRLKEKKLDGVYYIADSRREYPNGSIGGQVIGVCDVDGNGITGLELQYDDILRGKAGTYSAERGEKGAPIPGGVKVDEPAVDGEDIMISIDIKLQAKMEEALEKGLSVYEGKKGTSIAIDGETGEIYAACSYPYLDPTDMENSIIGSENLNCINQSFEPGSIFKTVTALTALEQDAMHASDTMFVPAELPADEYIITDSHERYDEIMSFSRILNESSNVGISLVSERAGFENLYNEILRFKLTERTGVDYPGEAASRMPGFDEWARVTAYNISFGQGLTTTPLSMARFYGMIAADGVLATPHFLISKPQTNEWIEYPTETIVTDTEALSELKTMLCGVVEEGTGKDAVIEGFDVAGKTSTAEIAENGTYAEDRYNLCFAGFINNSNSKLACFVSANDIHYEGRMASVFHDIMLEAIDLYNIVPAR